MSQLRLNIHPGEVIVKHEEANDGTKISGTRYRRSFSYFVRGKMVSLSIMFSPDGVNKYPSTWI
jgi:hypothetical protein